MDELVKRAQQGNKEAFTELILLLKADLYKIAKTRIKNDEDIYDAIQETMIIAFKSIKKLKKIESFKLLTGEYEDKMTEESIKHRDELYAEMLEKIANV